MSPQLEGEHKRTGILLSSLWYPQNLEQCLSYSRYSTDTHGKKEKGWEKGREGASIGGREKTNTCKERKERMDDTIGKFSGGEKRV